MTYSLWETESANIIGSFGSEADALVLIREIVVSMGEAYIGSFSLTQTADDGTVVGIAAGEELVSLARRFQSTVA